MALIFSSAKYVFFSSFFSSFFKFIASNVRKRNGLGGVLDVQLDQSYSSLTNKIVEGTGSQTRACARITWELCKAAGWASPSEFWLLDLGWGPRICISTMFSGNAAPAVLPWPPGPHFENHWKAGVIKLPGTTGSHGELWNKTQAGAPSPELPI